MQKVHRAEQHQEEHAEEHPERTAGELERALTLRPSLPRRSTEPETPQLPLDLTPRQHSGSLSIGRGGKSRETRARRMAAIRVSHVDSPRGAR